MAPPGRDEAVDKENISPKSPPTTPKKKSALGPTIWPTPRHHKTPTPSPAPAPSEEARAWTRLRGSISREMLSNVTEELFGCKPYDWQLDLVEKVLEGRDCIAVAGTGSGKSLVFAMLALAAELVQASGVIVVICPLKALQLDQVRRFDKAQSIKSKHFPARALNLRAVAVNEDNKDEKVFKDISKGLYRIVYASPECLLRNGSFKKLFRNEEFRTNTIALIVDEAHVVESWAKQFRKDYDELEALRVIMGSEIPSLALTGTCSTETFEIIYRALGMGRHRPFYGIDRGSNRPNLALWVRPMEYSASSLADLFAFIPNNLSKPEELVKTIFYFRTRRQARQACDIMRAILEPPYRNLLFPFTATNSEQYKEKIIQMLMDGEINWVFATKALGMGLDIPDIIQSVIYGVDTFTDVMQEGGRAGRARDILARMIWIVERWAIDPIPSTAKPTKKEEQERLLREKIDPPSRGFINSPCRRVFSAEFLTPQPRLPGFKWYKPPEGQDLEDIASGSIIWIAHEHGLKPGPMCGCNGRLCRSTSLADVGVLSNEDKLRVNRLLERLHPPSSGTLIQDSQPSVAPSIPPPRVNRYVRHGRTVP